MGNVSAVNTSDPHATAWDRFVERCLEDYLQANPVFAVGTGRHEFDGRLPDWSREGIAAEIARLHAEHARIETFDPALLRPEQRIERQHLLAQVDADLFVLEEIAWPFSNPLFYAGALDPNPYLTREYAPLAQRMKAYVGFAREVPRAVEQIRQNLRTPMPRTFAEMGELSFSGLAGYCEKDVPGIFAPVDDAGLQAEFQQANAPAVAAFRAMGLWFQERMAEDSDGKTNFRLGAGLFSRMLARTERVHVPLPVLEEAGRRELERNLANLREACAAYAPELSVAACLERVQAEKPEGGPVEAARRQLAGLRRFLEEKELVTIPGTEEAQVAEAPPYQRWNAAYIDIPGSYDRHLPSIYYIAPPDPAWTPEEQAAYIPGEADLLFITIHEVWPGHFLQFLHSNRAKSAVGRLFVTYAFAEGWAHYAEELMWEAGFGGDPRTRIGQIQNALLRNVRYLVALGLHAGEMTLEEAERMFREQAFQDPANARQQAARGTFDPAYLNYTLGKLMVRRLRDDWTAARGNGDARDALHARRHWREFHDRFLSFGGPPIPLVREAMLGPDSGPVF